MNGREHRRLNLIVAPGIIGSSAAIAYYLSESSVVVMGIEAAVITAFVFQYAINPDLDILENSIEAKLNRRWIPSWIYGSLLKTVAWMLLRTMYRIGLIYMWVYARLIPHRHPLSHAPILGTVLRLGYVLWPLVFIYSWLICNIGIMQIASFIIIVTILDTVHWFADGMPLRQARRVDNDYS